MNKQEAKKLVSLLTALALVLGTVFISTDKALAEEAELTPPVTIYDEPLWGDAPSYIGFSTSVEDFDWDSFDEKAKLISLESADESVIKVETDGTDMGNCRLIPQKIGESKITMTYEFDGKTYTTSTVIKVKKYPWAVKKTTLNGKKLKIKEGDNVTIKKNYKKDSIKVKIVPKSGWKFDYVGCSMVDKKGNYKDVKITKKTIKKGLKIKFPKKYKNIWVSVNLINKNGDRFQYMVDIYR